MHFIWDGTNSEEFKENLIKHNIAKEVIFVKTDDDSENACRIDYVNNTAGCSIGSCCIVYLPKLRRCFKIGNDYKEFSFSRLRIAYKEASEFSDFIGDSHYWVNDLEFDINDWRKDEVT